MKNIIKTKPFCMSIPCIYLSILGMKDRPPNYPRLIRRPFNMKTNTSRTQRFLKDLEEPLFVESHPKES